MACSSAHLVCPAYPSVIAGKDREEMVRTKGERLGAKHALTTNTCMSVTPGHAGSNYGMLKTLVALCCNRRLVVNAACRGDEVDETIEHKQIAAAKPVCTTSHLYLFRYNPSNNLQSTRGPG